MSLRDSSNSIPNYVELAAIVIPPRKHGLKDRLRRACGFLPMPLSLGWDADPRDDGDPPPDSTVAGLMLSDIGSGAARQVTARWMHALYKYTTEHHQPGTVVMLLREANFTARFQTAHALVLGAFVLQLAAIPTAVYFGQRIEALLVLAAALIRLVEGIFSWTYPRFRTPRADAHRLQQDNVPRYLMLHTGMTTTHLLIVAHRVGYSGPFIVLEDAAVPLPPLHKSRYQDLARLALMLSVWLQKAAALFTSADGYFIPLALLFGTCVIELVVASESFTETTLPERAETVLTTGRSLLDRITAACQFTNQVSVGFVETLLPDPHGEHTDYHWIVQAMDPDIPLAEHRTHPDRAAVLQTTLRRRNMPRAAQVHHSIPVSAEIGDDQIEARQCIIEGTLSGC